MRYLTIALAEGRLARKTMELSEEIGISCDEIKDKDSRKLIFVSEELGVQFFPVKASDVSTYVECEAAGIDIVGKGTILEEGHKLYEVINLGVEKCRVCICGPESTRESLKHHELIRVAIKYPSIAKDYFYSQRYQTMGIIKLGGSIEPAPTVGPSKVIVDIVGAGSTLRENGLAVLGKVYSLSTCMVVSQMSMKTENKRITGIIKDFQIILKDSYAHKEEKAE